MTSSISWLPGIQPGMVSCMCKVEAQGFTHDFVSKFHRRKGPHCGRSTITAARNVWRLYKSNGRAMCYRLKGEQVLPLTCHNPGNVEPERILNVWSTTHPSKRQALKLFLAFSQATLTLTGEFTIA